MQRSPCLNCDLRDQDKRNSICEHCQERLDYVDGIGDTTASMPIENTDLLEKESPIMRKLFTADEKQFLSDNFDSMTHKEMAEKLGRSTPSITQKLAKMGLRKNFLKTEDSNQNRDLKSLNQIDEYANRDFFILDFSKHPELFDDLKQLSESEFRTPENQILFLIKSEIERKTV